jgi:hypothetical protein
LRNSAGRKKARKTVEWIFGLCVLVALPIGIAEAGQCTTEIENVTKLLAARDAGSGPTAGAATSTTIGQYPPSAAMGAADLSTAASSTAAESGRPQHPPTAAMNEATRSGGASLPAGSPRQQHPPTARHGRSDTRSATSPQEVQSQIRGGPAAALEVGAVGVKEPSDGHAKEPFCLLWVVSGMACAVKVTRIVCDCLRYQGCVRR